MYALRVRLFWVKMISFSACLAVTENDIFRKMTSGWPIFSPLTRKWFSPLIFTSKHFRKKREREGERARAREEKKPNSQSISRRRRSPVRAPGGAISRRSRSRAVASSGLRSWSTRAVARSRSQIDREIAPSRARTVDREIAIVDDIFLGFVFSFFFSKHQKIFYRKIFWNATKHREIFSFSRN